MLVGDGVTAPGGAAKKVVQGFLTAVKEDGYAVSAADDAGKRQSDVAAYVERNPAVDIAHSERDLKSPLGERRAWVKPTVLLGSAGHLLAAPWKVFGGSG